MIKCRIRGTSTINWVIENGAEVEVGDELIRLENKLIEDYLYERTKFAHLSLDAAIGFRAEAHARASRFRNTWRDSISRVS